MLALSLFTALAMGLGIAWLLRPTSGSASREFPLLVFFSVGLGVGASSVWFFLWLTIFGPHRSKFIASEIGIVALLAMFLIFFSRRNKSILSPPEPAPPASSWLWYLPGAAFLAALLAAATAFARYSAAGPHGAWDAWGDWNLRARFLYLGGSHWTDVFMPAGTLPHRDYPLLLSASVARCWTYMKNDAQVAPIAIAFLFTFAIAGVLFCSLALLRNRSQGFLAATVLLATPFFLILGAAQYADVPFAFFFLSTVVLLCLYEHSCPGDKRGLALAGTMAGLTVWTKDEGGLLLLCLLASHLILTARSRGFTQYRRELLSLLAGLLPVLCIVVFFKLRFAWHTDFVSSHGLWHRVRDVSRYPVVFGAIGKAFLNFGAWALSLPPLLIVYVLLVGVQPRQGQLAAKIGAATLLLTALGYLCVYLTTPLPVQWLLLTSLTRLCIQLYPTALFLLFFFARTPEEALHRAHSQAKP